MTIKLLAALGFALAIPGAASAAIVQTFADRPAFAAAVPGVAAHSLALPGTPPVFVSSLTAGGLTVTALDGLLAGDGIDILSTELDADTLVLDFAMPVFGAGLYGGIVDFDFAYVDGALLVDAVGSGTSVFAAPGASYFGFISDVAFTRLRISLMSFDTNVTSVAFVGLQGRVDEALGTATVPEPAAWTLMIAGFALVGSRQRRVRALAA